MKKLRTAEEARQWLSYHGITVSQWAREHGFSVSLVFEVLAGRKPCRTGRSHNIAVLLGMKDGVLTDRPARVSPAHKSTRYAGQQSAKSERATPIAASPVRQPARHPEAQQEVSA